MTNIYLTVWDEEAIVDFVKDHKELYTKTNGHFKDKARKECIWERFTKSAKLSVKLCQTWFKSQRTRWQAHAIEVCTDHGRDEAISELDTGQVWISYVTH